MLLPPLFLLLVIASDASSLGYSVPVYLHPTGSSPYRTFRVCFGKARGCTSPLKGMFERKTFMSHDVTFHTIQLQDHEDFHRTHAHTHTNRRLHRASPMFELSYELHVRRFPRGRSSSARGLSSCTRKCLSRRVIRTDIAPYDGLLQGAKRDLYRSLRSRGQSRSLENNVPGGNGLEYWSRGLENV